MPRPRTKGEPIQFRLSVDDDEFIRIKAAKEDLTPADFCAALVRRYCEDRTVDRQHRLNPASAALPQCQHKWVAGASGLSRCSTCGEVKTR